MAVIATVFNHSITKALGPHTQSHRLSNDTVGNTMEEKALVNQWMEYRITRIDPCDNDARCLQGILKVILFLLAVYTSK